MPSKSKPLLIAASEAYSGKSALILGIAAQLSQKGFTLGYGKPIETSFPDLTEVEGERDCQFIAQALGLSENQVKSPLLFLNQKTLHQYLAARDEGGYRERLQGYFAAIEADLVFLEGADDLQQGSAFHLSTPEIAQTLDAGVLLVVKYHPLSSIDLILYAQKVLGDRFLGIAFNHVPAAELNSLQDSGRNPLQGFLRRKGIEILGMLPENKLLQSVSVRELVRRLKAKVLCRKDRLDLMVESLTVGAMNVNSALEYFRQRQNMAVVTGGDRTDLQLAALESSTNCLILTGNTPPQQLILARAEDLEIPILTVDFDTLTTVKIVDGAFGKVKLQEKIKVDRIRELVANHVDVDRLLSLLKLN